MFFAEQLEFRRLARYAEGVAAADGTLRLEEDAAPLAPPIPAPPIPRRKRRRVRAALAATFQKD